MGGPSRNPPEPRSKALPKGLRLTTSERRKISLMVATRKGSVCKFGYACKHGSRCRGRHSPSEEALFKTRELRVSKMERAAGCAYCRAGVCRFGLSCRGQTVIRAAAKRASSCTQTPAELVLPPPRPKLRKRGRRRPRGRPPKESKQGRRLERQERREREELLGTPSTERVPDSWPPRRKRTVRDDSESSSSEDEEPTPREDQPGLESHHCCSEDPVCRIEARMQFCGLWFCDLHSPSTNVQAGQRFGTPTLESMRASWNRIANSLTGWIVASSAWGLGIATSGWTSLQHGQLTRAGAGSLIALLFAIGWVTAAASSAVVTIVLPALHAARQQREKQRDHEARAEAARRVHATFNGMVTDPSESDCLRLIHQWRREMRLQRAETTRPRMPDWGDSCEEDSGSSGLEPWEMDDLVCEIAEAGGGTSDVWIPGYQECVDRRLERVIKANMGDASSDDGYAHHDDY